MVNTLTTLPEDLDLILGTQIEAHNCVTPVPGDPILFGLQGYPACKWYIDIHEDKTPIHTKQNNN